MQAKVLAVNNVWLQRTTEERFFIVASGSVPTSGWRDGALHPRIYIRPPEDGMWDWDFTASPPNGIAADVISQVNAQSAEFPPPAWMRGVRVHASTNSIDAFVDEARAPIAGFATVTAGGDYFPRGRQHRVGWGVFDWRPAWKNVAGIRNWRRAYQRLPNRTLQLRAQAGNSFNRKDVDGLARAHSATDTRLALRGAMLKV